MHSIVDQQDLVLLAKRHLTPGAQALWGTPVQFGQEEVGGDLEAGLADGAEDALAHQPADLAIRRQPLPHFVDRDQGAAFSLRADDPLRVSQVEGERLLAQDVTAGRDPKLRERGMRIRTGGDVDEVGPYRRERRARL